MRKRVVTAVAAAVVALAAVSGCGSSTSPAPTSSHTDAVALPPDYPASAVPLARGLVQSADGSAAAGWDIVVAVTVAPQTTAPTVGAASTPALETAVQRLVAAGFREDQRHQEGTQIVVMLVRAVGATTYFVQLGAVAGGASGPNTVHYTVTAQQ